MNKSSLTNRQTRKISANYIFPVTRKPLKNGIIVVDENGEIVDLIDTDGVLREQCGLEFYNGILVPGLVNAHCHLELSHLRNKITPKTGLPGFIAQISKREEASLEKIVRAAQKADRELHKQGVVACGDISNRADTFGIKAKSKIFYHTFIEIFGFDSERAKTIFESAQVLSSECYGDFSIVPHAPYSISTALFKMIAKNAETKKSIFSIHNQESAAENEMFAQQNGVLMARMKALGWSASDGLPPAKTALTAYFAKKPKNVNILLIHNTFTTKADVENVIKRKEKVFFVLCPKANLFIENALPDVEMLHCLGAKIAIGTDSLAANDTLSVLAEMKTLHQNFPQIAFHEILKWATKNGADALEKSQKLGSFERGKAPGIVLISKFDFKTKHLTKDSTARLLVEQGKLSS